MFTFLEKTGYRFSHVSLVQRYPEDTKVQRITTTTHTRGNDRANQVVPVQLYVAVVTAGVPAKYRCGRGSKGCDYTAHCLVGTSGVDGEHCNGFGECAAVGLNTYLIIDWYSIGCL